MLQDDWKQQWRLGELETNLTNRTGRSRGRIDELDARI